MAEHYNYVDVDTGPGKHASIEAAIDLLLAQRPIDAIPIETELPRHVQAAWRGRGGTVITEQFDIMATPPRVLCFVSLNWRDPEGS